MESEDGPIYLWAQEFDSHYRHPRDPSRDFASQEVFESSRRWRVVGSFRRHEEASFGSDGTRSQPLRNAVRESERWLVEL